MASDGDEMLWANVAFLEKLRSLSDDEYNNLWIESQAVENKMGHGAMPTSGDKVEPGISSEGGHNAHSGHGESAEEKK